MLASVSSSACCSLCSIVSNILISSFSCTHCFCIYDLICMLCKNIGYRASQCCCVHCTNMIFKSFHAWKISFIILGYKCECWSQFCCDLHNSYMHKITIALRDPCEVVRRQTFILLSQLLQVWFLKSFNLWIILIEYILHVIIISGFYTERLCKVERSIVPSVFVVSGWWVWKDKTSGWFPLWKHPKGSVSPNFIGLPFFFISIFCGPITSLFSFVFTWQLRHHFLHITVL